MGAGPLCKVNTITLATPLPSPIINSLLPPLQKVAVYWLLTPPMLQAVYSLASGSHLYSGSQTVDYVANLTHNASVLICQVTAANHGAGRLGHTLPCHLCQQNIQRSVSNRSSRTWQGQNMNLDSEA